ncbi:uncharacterized protein LOC122860870 [Aphidius gifuensis]|uniref:uncharacterized protein LOC122860870 n=1 Tax=Aphidius gifuensis TaxID=684658 RepID=UPI001CDD84A8|nr:uncharacterized protein LOC122860870 [Aphidius gifuensis]
MTDIKLQYIPHMTTNSCCCFSSKRGCLIIGYFGAIMLALNAAILLINAVTAYDGSSKFILLILSAGISMAEVYAHCLLIQGVEEKEPRKMYLWIYIDYICLIVGTLLIGLCIILLTAVLISRNSEDFSDREKEPTSPSVYFLCLLAIAGVVGIKYHFFAAVVTHCQDLISMKSRERIYTP